MPDVDFYSLDESATVDEALFDITTTEYAFVIEQLLPQGKAWRWRPGGIAKRLFEGLAYEWSRVERRARELIEEMDPRTTQEMLEDWERVAGLPAICQGGDAPTTVEARQQALHSKLTAKVSGNVPFFLQLAENLGYPDAEIRYEGDPFLCTDPCTDGLYGFEGYWLDTWTLVTNDTTENDATLRCLVSDYAQAHEIILFEFP